jgi:hypothetical protein
MAEIAVDPASVITSSIADLLGAGIAGYVAIETADEQVAIEQAKAQQASAAAAASAAESSTSIGGVIAANPVTTALVVLGGILAIAWGMKR